MFVRLCSEGKILGFHPWTENAELQGMYRGVKTKTSWLSWDVYLRDRTWASSLLSSGFDSFNAFLNAFFGLTC